MAGAGEARWWTMRRAQSRRPATYRCPFCGLLLHAMSEHVLVAPEGEVDRRRHAHLECVAAERRAGRLRTQDEWRRQTKEARPGLLRRLLSRRR